MSSAPHPLTPILNPRAVAVLGASENTGKFGGRVMNFLLRHGFQGRVVPVNPGQSAVFGVPAVPNVAASPEKIDVALVALPVDILPGVIEECGRAGVRCCVVLTADFAEAGAAGAARETEIVGIARRYGMRLIGPNCLGFINPRLRLPLTSSIALAADPMPSGPIGLVSQSGSLMASVISHAQDLGTGFSVCVTVGNQADLEVCDFIDYMIEDPQTRAICAYIEGLKDGRRFLALAERARFAGKPIIAVKAGRSEVASRITQSHTASLAGSHAAWEAACRKHAVILLDDPESMVQCAHFLTAFGPPRTDGIAVFSGSGGTMAVTADRIAASGLRLADLSTATRAKLATYIPDNRPVNPLDIGGLARDLGLRSAQDAYDWLADDPDVGVVLPVVATTPQLEDKVRAWGQRALERKTPTALLFTPGSLVDGARQSLRDIGCPFTNRIDDTLRVIRAATEYAAALRTPIEQVRTPTGFSAARGAAATTGAGALTEPQAKALIAAAGIPLLAETVASTPDEAVAAAQAIGYPVAMKGVCRALVHKSDAGAVKLGLASEAAVRAAWSAIATAVAGAVPCAAIEGCLVAPMAGAGVEMIVGAKYDAQFGPLVLIGAGGVLVELLADVQTALAPVTPAETRAMLERLRAWKLLQGVRGRPPADVDALVDAVVRVSHLAAALGPRLVELDINPLLVKTRGEGAVALDARATLS
ncbi:MAG: acetate--CoA ligase family protein [Burkholderiales bacterium]